MAEFKKTIEKINGLKNDIRRRLFGESDRYSVSCKIEVGESPIASDNTFSDMTKFVENGKKMKFSSKNNDLGKVWKEYIRSGKSNCQVLRGQASKYRKLCSARDSKMQEIQKERYEQILSDRNAFKKDAKSLMEKEREKTEAVKKIKQKRAEALKNLEELKTQLNVEKSKQEKISESAELSKGIPRIAGVKSLNELESTLSVIYGVEGHSEIKQHIDNLAKKLKGQIESLSEKFKAEGGNFTTEEAWEIYFSDIENPKRNFKEACSDLSANQLKEVNSAIDEANNKLKALEKVVKNTNTEYKKKVKATEKEQKKAEKEAAKQEKAKARAEEKAAKAAKK